MHTGDGGDITAADVALFGIFILPKYRIRTTIARMIIPIDLMRGAAAYFTPAVFDVGM